MFLSESDLIYPGINVFRISRNPSNKKMVNRMDMPITDQLKIFCHKAISDAASTSDWVSCAMEM